MADTTQLTSSIGSTTDATHVSVQHNGPRSTGYLPKPYAEYTTSQKLQIELHRLKFLKDCKTCNDRPFPFASKEPQPSKAIQS